MGLNPGWRDLYIAYIYNKELLAMSSGCTLLYCTQPRLCHVKQLYKVLL